MYCKFLVIETILDIKKSMVQGLIFSISKVSIQRSSIKSLFVAHINLNSSSTHTDLPFIQIFFMKFSEIQIFLPLNLVEISI